MNILQYESKIWATADLLRGCGIKESEWPSFMMPFFALAMIESRLVRMFDDRAGWPLYFGGAAGIGHPGQPTRLQARWRSQPRGLLPLEFPAHPASVPDADSVHDQRQTKIKRHPKELDGVLILVGRRLPNNKPKVAWIVRFA